MFSDISNYLVLTYNFLSQQILSPLPFQPRISAVLPGPWDPVFPGPWDDYIKAPFNKSHIRPAKLWHAEGSVSLPEAILEWEVGNSSTTLGPGGLVTLEFPENIAGR